MNYKGCADAVQRRLSRVTSSGLFLPEIDALRFVAIFMVFLFHASGYVQAKCGVTPQSDQFSSVVAQTIGHFNFGVQLFFVISGFILAVPFAIQQVEARPHVNAGVYYFRRVSRLCPPYFANLLVVFVLLMFIKAAPASEMLPHLFASVFFLHNLIYGEPSTINYVAWALEIEVQFYLLVPLLGAVFAISKPFWRRGLILAACLFPIILQQAVPSIPFCILRYLQYFMLGFLLANVFVFDWKRRPTRDAMWDVLSFLGWVAMLLLLDQKRLGPWLLPVCALLCYIGAFRGRWFNRLFCNRWLVTIGGMCYTIYLYHFLIISLVGRFTARHSVGALFWPNLALQVFLLGTCVLLGSALLFVIIEKPCMQRDWPLRFRASLGRLLRAK